MITWREVVYTIDTMTVYTGRNMGISIRNPEVGELARKLAELRKTNMTEAIAHALRSELKREQDKRPLAERLEELARETMAMAGPNGREMTKDEIDDLWGQ